MRNDVDSRLTDGGLDRTGMLTRLSQIQQVIERSSLDGLGELARKIRDGEPVVLGPATAWSCPHCGFHQPDTEFANGIVWRSDPEVPMGEHIRQLHEDLTYISSELDKHLRVLEKKAVPKRARTAPVTGRAVRGRRGSAKKGKR